MDGPRYRVVSGSGPVQSRILSRSTYSTFPHRYLSSITRCMTLSRARDPFAGINHWKRKHIPAATQICQHPTAGESGERGTTSLVPPPFERVARTARQTESVRGQRGRSVEGRRETAARARKQTRNHDTAAAYGPLCCACTHCHGSESESWRERGRAAVSERARAMEGREERAHEVF